MFRICAVVLFLASICFSQQTDNSKKESFIKGGEIIRQAREAVGISSSMKSFQIKLHKFSDPASREDEFATDLQNDITISFPNQVYDLYGSKKGTLLTTIWNEGKFDQTGEITKNGQRKVFEKTSIQLTGDKTPIKEGTAEFRAHNYSDNLWNEVFALILAHPIETSAKFEYLGRAKAGEGMANLVQTKSVFGSTMQFFFDEKTNQLLMMIKKYRFSGRDIELKYYYSNREKRDGVLIPTKIKVENKSTSPGKPPTKFTEYVELLDFKINPPISQEIFTIK